MVTFVAMNQHRMIETIQTALKAAAIPSSGMSTNGSYEEVVSIVYPFWMIQYLCTWNTKLQQLDPILGIFFQEQRQNRFDPQRFQKWIFFLRKTTTIKSVLQHQNNCTRRKPKERAEPAEHPSTASEEPAGYPTSWNRRNR